MRLRAQAEREHSVVQVGVGLALAEAHRAVQLNPRNTLTLSMLGETLALSGDRPAALRIAAVRQFVGPERVLVSIVDSARREIYGQRYLDGEYDRLEEDARRYVTQTMAALRVAADGVRSRSGDGPSEVETAAALRAEVARLVAAGGGTAKAL